MTMFARALGRAAEVNPLVVEKEINRLLLPGEPIKKVYKHLRDYYVFTSKRLVVVEKHGLTAKKVEYQSIPYKSLFRFSIETAGHTDLDSELKIWVAGASEPLEIKFDRFLNIYEIQAILAGPFVK